MSAPYAECDLQAIAADMSVAERFASEFALALLATTSVAAVQLAHLTS